MGKTLKRLLRYKLLYFVHYRELVNIIMLKDVFLQIILLVYMLQRSYIMIVPYMALIVFSLSITFLSYPQMLSLNFNKNFCKWVSLYPFHICMQCSSINSPFRPSFFPLQTVTLLMLM
jgi:hypothetical protein